MTTRRGFLILLTVCATVVTGCTHFHEGRAITAFTEALNAGDLETMRDATSVEFKSKALRRAEAMDDLEILGLPEASPSIVEVKDVSETRKEVTVTTAEGESDLLYSLVLEPITKKWVVDDVFTRQQQAGVTVSKPVTEQMDLLLTIRDFLEAWDNDNRDAVLNITTDEFKETLSALPAPWLARVTQRVVGDGRPAGSQKQRPQVAIDGSEAVVQLSTPEGRLRLSMEFGEDGWKVADVGIQARREGRQIGSIRNHARVILAGTKFTDAFRTEDRSALKAATTKTFFEQSLKDARLSQVSLPDITLAPTDYEVKATIDHASMLVPSESGALRIEFQRFDDPIVASKATYRVKEASLYDSKGKNEVRLSALFTAEQRVRSFLAALEAGRLKELKNLSTTDFSHRVWSRANGLPLQLLPLGAASGKVLRAADTTFEGSQTFVTVMHATGTAKYKLTDAGGRLMVDDILVDRAGKTASLKRDLQVAIPILKFAGAFQTNQIPDLQRVSSHDFGRRVWDRTDLVPETDLPVLGQLTRPISKVRIRPGRATVVIGSESDGAVVTLLEERSHWVIDDVELVTGLLPSQHVQMKSTLTQIIANARFKKGSRSLVADAGGTSRKRFDLRRKDVPEPARLRIDAETKPAPLPKPASPASEIRQASFEPQMPVLGSNPATPTPSGVRHALHLADDQGASLTAEPMLPGVLDAAPNAVPVSHAELEDDWLPKPSSEIAVKTTAKMDQDEIAALFEGPSTGVSESPVARVSPVTAAKLPPREMPVNNKVVPIANGVPSHDAGRVTDPSLQPIAIPR